jgi:hypothetical protein
MRTIPYFNTDPKSGGWLAKAGLKVGELVQIQGLRGTYRYSIERDGQDHVLTPAEPLIESQHRHFGKRVVQ